MKTPRLSLLKVVPDWSHGQWRNNLEMDKALRGKMRLIHLNATNDSVGEIGLSSYTQAELDSADVLHPLPANMLLIRQ